MSPDELARWLSTGVLPDDHYAGPAGPFCFDDIHRWFELSYVSYLVLPRSLLQIMPNEWQHQFAALLEQMGAEYPGENSTYAVYKRGAGGRFESDPLGDYRYTHQAAIDAAKGKA